MIDSYDMIGVQIIILHGRSLKKDCCHQMYVIIKKGRH